MEIINQKKLLVYFNEMDSELNGISRKINIYCVGGTALTLQEDKVFSNDIDVAVSNEDFRALSGIAAQIRMKKRIRCDFFIDGELVDYSLPRDYRERARKIGSFENINLYAIDLTDLIIMKAIAGREKDLKDVYGLLKLTSKYRILKRFNQFQFKEGKKEGLEAKLRKFIGEVYK